jgi:hypothetical protein
LDDERATSDLSEREEDDLDVLLGESLFRISFFMETNYLRKVGNPALRDLYETCGNHNTGWQDGRGNVCFVWVQLMGKRLFNPVIIAGRVW